MTCLAADVNFRNRILRGLRLRCPTVDLVRVQDAIPPETPDPEVLSWCADNHRLLLSHDVSTMLDFAYWRVDAGLAMPGVFLVAETELIGPIINDLALIVEASAPEEWHDRVVYLPLTK